MIPARILGTAAVLPGVPVTNDEVARAVPGMDPAWIEARTGIRTRHWAEPGASVGALAAEALRGALADAGLAPEDLRRVLFVTSTGGEHTIPTMASDVIDALGLHGSCDGLDLNNSCVGFLTALELSARHAATGLAPVGVVVAEPFSRCITPADPRPYVIFGDAYAAAVIGAGRPGEGILGASFGTDRALGSVAWMPRTGASLASGAPELISFQASNREMGELAVATLVRTAREVLARAGTTIADVDWVLPHQPNGHMLRRIVEALEVPEERIVPVVAEIGSVGAASVAVSLDRLRRTRVVRPGARILMLSVGAGVAYGALLFQTAG
jgi:3-oxoacyl-(acyl-carrier-protein) synthase III